MTKKIEEIIFISETEYLVGDSRVQILDGNIVYVEAVGEQTDEIALLHFNYHQILKERFNCRLHYCIDLNKCGKNSSTARGIWSKMMQDDCVYKVALFGMHPVAKLLASFVMGVTRKGNFRFFSKKEDALIWIRE